MWPWSLKPWEAECERSRRDPGSGNCFHPSSCQPSRPVVEWLSINFINYNLHDQMRAFLLLSIVILLAVISACDPGGFDQQKQRLELLVQARSSKEEAIKLFGTNYSYYVKGGTNWIILEGVLTRESPFNYVAVRKGMQRWANAMFYSTPDMMTWVFLDEKEQVAEYVVGAQ